MQNFSVKKWGLITGISLLIMAIAAGFSYGYVFGELVVPGDAGATLEKITASSGLYLSGIAGWILIFLLDLIVTWALYQYFRSVHKTGSSVTAILRFVYTLILGWGILQLLSGYGEIGNLQQEGMANASALAASIASFEQLWSNGLIIFGLHLIGLGVLAWMANHVPNLWSILLIFAGMCYVFVSAGNLIPSLEAAVASVENILAIPMTIGELGFGIWLLVKGVRK
jgi:hypothetical protein